MHDDKRAIRTGRDGGKPEGRDAVFEPPPVLGRLTIAIEDLPRERPTLVKARAFGPGQEGSPVGERRDRGMLSVGTSGRRDRLGRASGDRVEPGEVDLPGGLPRG